MNSCVKCDYEGKTAFLSEEISCKCGETILIEYHICPTCGMLWRSVDGEPTEETFMNFNDVSHLFSEDAFTMEEQALFVKAEEEVEREIRRREGKASMSDYVTRCIRCQSIVHEEREGLYRCRECGFEWEVVTFE